MQTSMDHNFSPRNLCQEIPSCQPLGLTSTKLRYLVANFGVC